MYGEASEYQGFLLDVINLYFDVYFPRAIATAATLRGRGGQEGLKWMTQSYLVGLYLDCPTGIGVHCPNATSLAAFKDAVTKGDIYWHGEWFGSAPTPHSSL